MSLWKFCAVAGIHLITDTLTGKQYVGSAYGKDGVVGRWCEYALKSLGRNLLQRCNFFFFTISRDLSLFCKSLKLMKYL